MMMMVLLWLSLCLYITCFADSLEVLGVIADISVQIVAVNLPIPLELLLNCLP